MMNSKFLYVVLLAFMLLIYLISFPATGFAEKIKTNTIELNSVAQNDSIELNDSIAQNERSGRRRPQPSAPYSAPYSAPSAPSLPPDSPGGRSSKRDKNDLPKIEQAATGVGISLLWDFDYFNGANCKRDQNDHRWCSASELRQASIALKSKLNRAWQAKLQVTFNDEGDLASEIDDAYIEFTGWDKAILTIGKAKEPFGLEELTSSEDVTAIERAMATRAFAPGRQPGLGLSGDISQFTWAVGVYKAIDRKDKGDTYALTSRLTFAPWKHKSSMMHFGLAGSVRDFSGEKYEIQECAEVHTAEKIVTSVKTLADKVNLLGLEAAWVSGPFSMQAEYMTASMKADIGDHATYAGYYLQGSYFLTGESRPYKKGTFDRIKPSGRYGALELLSRYSVLDAADDNTDHDPRNSTQVKAANLTFGVNYYLNEQVRLATNYINTSLTGDLKDDRDSAQGICFRVQYSL